MNRSDIKPLYEAPAIAARVQELGKRLQSEVASEDPLLIGVLGGSVIFLADLVRAISTPLRFEFVQVAYDAHEGEETLDIRYPIPIDVTGQSVLIVKDVVGSGVIETYLSNQFGQKGASRVRFVALIDLPKERKTHCAVDYSVFTTEREGRLVGYGMKVDGRFGSLPGIGLLDEEDRSES